MPFNSIEFFVYLWLSLAAFYATPLRFRRYTLLFACYLFYALWNLNFLGLLILSTAIAYGLARWMQRAADAGQKRIILLVGLVYFLGSFVFFKGLPIWRGQFCFLSSVVMPIGLSYYTFRLTSYLIDVYWEKINPENELLSFASYAAFFPHLLSGPIQRSNEYFPQLHINKNEPNIALWASGLRLILCGLFKKLVIADNIGVVVDNVFGHASMYNSTALWIAVYAFYIQIYADFSGLANIAIGAGQLFGIDSPPNFNAPYMAKNVQDFWRRWHMTLCRWINDYLFLPLRMFLRGQGNAGLVLSVFISMLAISLWHDVSSGFIAFGIIQGTLISISTFSMRPRDDFFKCHKSLARLRSIAGVFITFHLMVFSFIFFRSTTAAAGFDYIRGLFAGSFKFTGLGMGLGPKALMGCFLALILAELFEYSLKTRGRWGFERLPQASRWGVYYGMMGAFLWFGRFWPKEFIYFKF